MSDKDQYKDSVFLPKTDFPMRGGLPQKEPEILKQWADMDLYGQLRTQAAGKPKWVLHDGPPYANGNLHMGHAVNKILKDVIVKSWQMNGYDAPYVPGWDCHGLPIEWKIEEKYRDAGKDKDEVDIIEFRDECRQFAQEWTDIQSEQFQRFGVLGDWKNPYRTMTYKAEGGIVREILKFAKNGGLYKGAKPVMWSVVEKTALAEAEVEYMEHKSITIWVRFPVVKAGHKWAHLEEAAHNPIEIQRNQELLEGADFVIWTTTPWTIPSNRAMAYGENIKYGVYEVKSVLEDSKVEVGAKLVLALALADEVKAKGLIEKWDLVGELSGEDMAGTECQHPFAKLDPQYDAFVVPLLAADYVTDDAGTGFVHIAPSHGEEDFNLVRNHNALVKAKFGFEGEEEQTFGLNEIEITDNVSDDGKFRPHVGLFAGMEVYTQEGKIGDGNFAILKALMESGALLAKGSVRHEYPHSWRSKAPLIFRTTPQWFISMDNKFCDGGAKSLREVALGAIKDTNWIPAKGEARINAMIEGRPDWCISRQRAWGVPIALFLHKETGDVLVDDAVFDRIADMFEAEGADSWWSRDPQDFLGADYNADEYSQVFDIVDVWFESGSTHAFVVGDTQTWPCFEGVDRPDLYLEGSDQHRGWFHSSLLESCGTNGRAPYKNVLTHGFVLDDKGYKMSKSVGNIIDPADIMKESGADILRLWTMSADYAEDIRLGKDTMKNTGDLYRRIRNTLRFLLGAIDGFDAQERVDLSDVAALPELERLMLHELHVMDAQVRSNIEGYEFGKLANMLHQFCNQSLSAFYFDIRKDRLYCDAADGFERRACRTVMAEIFRCLSAWLAPILCFTTEEAWSYRPRGVFEDDAVQSAHLREFPKMPEAWCNDALAKKWEEIRHERKAVMEAIEPLRASKALGSSLEALPILVTESKAVQSIGAEMADVCITSQIKVQDGESSIEIKKAEGDKCQRCWKILPEVADNGGICTRCSDAVKVVKAA